MFLKTKHGGYDGFVKKTPLPRTRVRGSETGRPLMAALDLLGKCEGLSSSVLYERLRELSEAELIAKSDDNKYELTALGASLGMALNPLDRWATNWARHVEEN